MNPDPRTIILMAPVGSTVHGLNLPGTDDLDLMGVCVENIDDAMGFSPFEQHIHRTAAEREGKVDAKSQPGDTDLVVYSLRKYLRLALHGNPTILNLLYVPHNQCTVRPSLGAQLQELAPSIISRKAGRRYLGYLESQRQRLMGERGQKRSNRPELEALHGYDTKYAMQMLRLGFQGVELLSTGTISLPMPEPSRTYLMMVRRGEVPLEDVLQATGDKERELKDLLDTSPLSEEPNNALVEKWMLDVYFQNWKAREPLEELWRREAIYGVVAERNRRTELANSENHGSEQAEGVHSK
jgi:uncharacterized protein